MNDEARELGGFPDAHEGPSPRSMESQKSIMVSICVKRFVWINTDLRLSGPVKSLETQPIVHCFHRKFTGNGVRSGGGVINVTRLSTTYITDGFRPSAHGLLRKSVMGRAISRPQGPALIISDIKLPPYTLLVHGTDAMSLHDSDADLTVMWRWNIAREDRDMDVDLGRTFDWVSGGRLISTSVHDKWLNGKARRDAVRDDVDDRHSHFCQILHSLPIAIRHPSPFPSLVKTMVASISSQELIPMM
ncbi:hypothetical protein ARMSODRAFT_979393 [Armillaria solidipes]|uniref:Uncharacterized protein n=1 Tax=Armillaria solidipes TaxID=1076256 RepID=A0A2H3BD91_9AGAR|nr:hypothetical protein ARMSODRAFT_979393 [Armillaria solidipes]